MSDGSTDIERAVKAARALADAEVERFRRAHAALARLEAAERGLPKNGVEWMLVVKDERDRAEAAEARLKAVTRERDRLKRVIEAYDSPGALGEVFAAVAGMIEAADRRAEVAEVERNSTERMFAAAVYATPGSEITVWPEHLLKADLTLERYDDPLNKVIRFRAAHAARTESDTLDA